MSSQVGVGQLSKSQQLLRLIRERGGTAQFWEIQVGAACPYLFLYLLHPSGRVSKSTIFSNHNLISVRHRKYRLIILLYLHVISCSSLLDLASSRDPEPRPSLESSNHSGLDLMLASIVESDLVFGYVSFSVSALNIQR